MPARPYCDVAAPVPLHDTFTYRVPPEMQEELSVGARVVVPFGSRRLVGVVTSLSDQPRVEESLRDVIEVIDSEPLLTPVLLELGRWMSAYYCAPPGEVYRSMLPLHGELARRIEVRLVPAGVKRLEELEREGTPSPPEQAEYKILLALAGGKSRRWQSLARRVADGKQILLRLRRRGLVEVAQEIKRQKPRPEAFETPWLASGCDLSASSSPVLTAEQEKALREIERLLVAGGFATLLVHGVTGSGKTEVYARAIESCLARDRTALLLVPEIALTPAVTGLFAARWGDRVAVLHSGLTDRERSEAWWRLRRCEARVAVGTRSAVFAPLTNLGVVIVDEEQDTSYKQAETPRYHGRDTALMRAKLEGAVAVLGSATPALETSYQVSCGRYQKVELESRVAGRPLATVSVIDMRAEFQETRKPALLSRALVEAVERALGAGEQVLLLLNRRGYASAVLCRRCGGTVQCRNCSVSLTLHRTRGRLLCHYCGFARVVPQRCEKCGSEHLYFVGEGAEKVEEAVERLFRQARVARMDRDTIRGRRRAEQVLGRFARGELNVLVGTQMIAKGHNFQGLTLVGVVSADVILGLPDFRAAERTFQLLTQVAGRAGRGALAGQVLVQTYHPEHYAIRYGAAQDYGGFYEQELKFRRLMHYPPFTALANLIVRHRRLEHAVCATRAFEEFFARAQAQPIRVLGPAPAPIARLKKDYRFQFLLKSPERRALQELLRQVAAFARAQEMAPGTLLVDVDPIHLL
jgi:primosomal protein N' (replication factor Y)